MNQQELLALIDARVATDPAFAALVAERQNDGAVAGALSVGRVKPRSYLITRRGVRRVLGARQGRLFVQALRAAAAAVGAVPQEHPAYDDLWWLGELLPDLDGAGIDIGDAETRTALRGLAALGPALGLSPAVTSAHCDALDAASSDPDPIAASLVSDALNARARGEA